MFHQVIAIIALAIGSSDASSVDLARTNNADGQVNLAVHSQVGRFGVQFRQPEWRENRFSSPEEMDNAIMEWRRNGWELQIFPNDLRVRYRLMQWGGSRAFNDLREAQDWARYLEDSQGYQTRVVQN